MYGGSHLNSFIQDISHPLQKENTVTVHYTNRELQLL